MGLSGCNRSEKCMRVPLRRRGRAGPLARPRETASISFLHSDAQAAAVERGSMVGNKAIDAVTQVANKEWPNVSIPTGMRCSQHGEFKMHLCTYSTCTVLYSYAQYSYEHYLTIYVCYKVCTRMYEYTWTSTLYSTKSCRRVVFEYRMCTQQVQCAVCVHL